MSAALLLWLGALAAAAPCERPMSRMQLGASLGEAREALDHADLPEARELLQEVADRLPCSEQVVDRELLGRFARLTSLSFFLAQEEEEARRWARLSGLAAPALPWEELVAEDHPFRALVADLGEPVFGEVEGRGLDVPRRGGAFVNGELATAPRAWAEVPTLVQVFDGQGIWVRAWWQDGAAFPAGALTDAPATPPPPPWWTGDPATSPTRLVLEGEPAPDPSTRRVLPVVGGGVLLAVSGISYALAGASQASLAESATSEELTRARTRANAWATVSGLSAAGAVGLVVGGVWVDGRSAGLLLRF